MSKTINIASDTVAETIVIICIVNYESGVHELLKAARGEGSSRVKLYNCMDLCEILVSNRYILLLNLLENFMHQTVVSDKLLLVTL